jgi:hypothetical protein
MALTTVAVLASIFLTLGIADRFLSLWDRVVHARCSGGTMALTPMAKRERDPLQVETPEEKPGLTGASSHPVSNQPDRTTALIPILKMTQLLQRDPRRRRERTWPQGITTPTVPANEMMTCPHGLVQGHNFYKRWLTCTKCGMHATFEKNDMAYVATQIVYLMRRTTRMAATESCAWAPRPWPDP